MPVVVARVRKLRIAVEHWLNDQADNLDDIEAAAYRTGFEVEKYAEVVQGLRIMAQYEGGTGKNAASSLGKPGKPVLTHPSGAGRLVVTFTAAQNGSGTHTNTVVLVSEDGEPDRVMVGTTISYTFTGLTTGGRYQAYAYVSKDDLDSVSERSTLSDHATVN